MKLVTIGFTKTSAANFFGRLRDSGAHRLLDVRLNNVSQLSGFAKRDDLKFFASELAGMNYRHATELAPTQIMLDGFKKARGSWSDYAHAFLSLMSERRIENTDPAMFDGACLLCSADTPHHCHRRLVADYLTQRWPDVQITHL